MCQCSKCCNCQPSGVGGTARIDFLSRRSGVHLGQCCSLKRQTGSCQVTGRSVVSVDFAQCRSHNLTDHRFQKLYPLSTPSISNKLTFLFCYPFIFTIIRIKTPAISTSALPRRRSGHGRLGRGSSGTSGSGVARSVCNAARWCVRKCVL